MPGELTPSQLVSMSLEHNLFFLRIMKEHSIFIEASFLCKDANLAEQADAFKDQFTDLLAETVSMANGHVSEAVLKSGQVVTGNTEKFEEMTQKLTGIVSDNALTRSQMQLQPGSGDPKMESEVTDLNNRAMTVTSSFIDFKTMLLQEKKNGNMATAMFYSELEHLRDEARHYVSGLQVLQQKQNPNTKKGIIHEKIFWGNKMGEHAGFIEHLLPPSEKVWIARARALAPKFGKLEARADAAQDKGILNKRLRVLIQDEITATNSLAKLKDTIAGAYQQGKVQALFLPIWPEHVLREAHHFLLELREYYSITGPYRSTY